MVHRDDPPMLCWRPPRAPPTSGTQSPYVNVLNEINPRTKSLRRRRRSSAGFSNLQTLKPLKQIKQIYDKVLLPLERRFAFEAFDYPNSAPLNEADFFETPMLLLIGQYSTGKTSFVKFLTDSCYPGMNIGPEPTTDSFVAVMGDGCSSNLRNAACRGQRVIPGNALCSDPRFPFGGLTQFGNSFLRRFHGSVSSSTVLDNLIIIDTPGVLSSKKRSGAGIQETEDYDLEKVTQWFADRADCILVFFDAHKLDICDEFKQLLTSLRPHMDKMTFLLNKVTSISGDQELMRVYGALMWSLGKVFKSPEVPKVIMGSFWDQELPYDEEEEGHHHRTEFLKGEMRQLLAKLSRLPCNVVARKINEFSKRIVYVKVQAYIMCHLKREMPPVFGKEGKKKELIAQLDAIYGQIQREHCLSPGDFPPLEKMQEMLEHQDFSKFNPVKTKVLEDLEMILGDDVSRLMSQIPLEDTHTELFVKGGAFDAVTHPEESPFGFGRPNGLEAGKGDKEWVVARYKYKYDELFEQLDPINGKISGAKAKREMVKSKLPNSVLGKVWRLSDIDRDGQLDKDEFALGMHLIQLKLDGHDLPRVLPDHLMPPTKKGLQGPGGVGEASFFQEDWSSGSRRSTTSPARSENGMATLETLSLQWSNESR